MKAQWEATGIKALILPTFIGNAFKHENAPLIGAIFDYCILWNVVHYPCGVVPVTEVQAGEDVVYDD